MNNKTVNGLPNVEIDVRETFDIDVDMKVLAFEEPNEHVPSIEHINSIKKQRWQFLLDFLITAEL